MDQHMNYIENIVRQVCSGSCAQRLVSIAGLQNRMTFKF